MALLLRRGLEADRLNFIPQEGELIYVTDTKQVYVGDGVTPGGILIAGGVAPTTPTYSLGRSTASVNEGQSFTITLTTTNVDNGTNVPYQITGVSSADINGASLSGNFTINNNTATLNVTTTADSLTEGNETFTITLVGITPTRSISVIINDTSVNPTTPTYSLDRSTASVNEGQSFTITLTTTNVDNGTNVPYQITGVSSADINGASLSGNFTVNSNTATLNITTTADSLTEGNETFTITLVGITPIVTTSVTINDTSVNPIGDEIDGGGPDTTVFDFVVDCGAPDTTEFDPIIDGGIIA